MKLWVPKPFYGLLPYYNVAVGSITLAASIYVNDWYWSPICAVVGAVSLVGGFVVWLKRRDSLRSLSPAEGRVKH